MSKLLPLLDRLLNPRARLVTEGPPIDDYFQNAVGDTARRRRYLISHSLRNTSLILGLIITFGLLLIVFFGPFWASQNPHLNPLPIPFSRYDTETNTVIRPPLNPSAEYPLGTDSRGIDNISNLLHGARITLTTATFITLARIIFGLVFGSIAGWNNGRLPDQAVMQLITIITAIPMLISGMILIYAIGIESGMTTFIIALSLIGWTEMAQMVRSEILVLRRQLFIEAARSIGLKEFEIVVRHLLPNIVPKLFVVSFLEMGAVLILMAELGFLGVFIGGVNRIQTDVFAPVMIFPDTPEWGAMLSQGFRYLRSKPFIVIGPAMAFFISIVGFNSLGEGLRSLFEQTSINTAFLLKKRFLLMVGSASLVTFLIIQNTGPSFWYQRTAASFDATAAQSWLDELETVESSQKPGTVVEGHEVSPMAAYLYETFQELDLQPGWKEGINSRFIYAPDSETAHVIGFWPGYDMDLAGELIILFTTYDVPGDNTENYPLALGGHDLTDLAVLLETIQHLKTQDINPRRSILFVAWQAAGSESGDLEEYVKDRDNFRRLSTRSGGVRIAPTMVLQIDSGENPEGIWVHPDSPELLADLINYSARQAGAHHVPAENQDINPLVSSLPWAYMAWTDSASQMMATDQNPLEQYGKTLFLTLITLLREEQSWIAEPEAIPQPVFIPPTPTPGEGTVDDSETGETKAVGIVEFIEPAPNVSYKPGDNLPIRFVIIGSEGTYRARQPYQDLRLRVSVRSAADESIVTFNQPRMNAQDEYTTFLRIPEEIQPGDYIIRITVLTTTYHGYDLELVGNFQIPLTIEAD